MDRIRAMTVFVAVCEAGSLSAASRRLREPLTNVSRLLAQLETHLGCLLLDRSTRRMALTPAGTEYLKVSKGILEAIEGAESRIAGHSVDVSGEISVTAPVVFGRMHILPLVTEFLARYPRVNARMLLVDRVVDLMEEDIDVAVRIGDLPDSSNRATRVATQRLIVCASPAYLSRSGRPMTVAALGEHDCVTFAGLSGGQRWVFKSSRYGTKSVRVRSRLSVNTADAAIAAAIAGVGITRVLAYQAEAALAEGRLVAVLERYEEREIPVHLVLRSSRSDSPRVRAFIDLAVETLRAVPGERPGRRRASL